MEEGREGDQAGEAADRGKLSWWPAGFNPRDRRGVYPHPKIRAPISDNVCSHSF